MATTRIRVFRLGVLCGTFAAGAPLEALLQQPCVQPAPAAGVMPCALAQRGAASVVEAVQYINGAVPAGDYEVIDALPSAAQAARRACASAESAASATAATAAAAVAGAPGSATHTERTPVKKRARAPWVSESDSDEDAALARIIPKELVVCDAAEAQPRKRSGTVAELVPAALGGSNAASTAAKRRKQGSGSAHKNRSAAAPLNTTSSSEAASSRTAQSGRVADAAPATAAGAAGQARPQRSCANSSTQTRRLMLISDCSNAFIGINRPCAAVEAAALFEQDALAVRAGQDSCLNLIAPYLPELGRAGYSSSHDYLFLKLLQSGGLLLFGEQRIKDAAEASQAVTALLPHLCHLIRMQLSGQNPVVCQVREKALHLVVVACKETGRRERGEWRVPVLQALLDAGANPNGRVGSDSVMRRRRQHRHHSLLLMWAEADWPCGDGLLDLLRAGADPAPDGDIDVLQVLVRRQAANVLGSLTQHADAHALLASLAFDAPLRDADALVAQSVAGDGALLALQTRHELRLLRDACSAHLQAAFVELQGPLIRDVANLVADYLRPPVAAAAPAVAAAASF